MTINGEMEFDLLQRIGFIRTAGTEEELRAAHILMDEVTSIGLTPTLEDFPIHDAEIQTATLEVLEPYRKTYTVTAFKCAENTDGLEADFLYVGNANEADLLNAKGKIVLVNGMVRLPVFRRLLEAGVAGFISMSGSLLDKEDETDLVTRKLRAALTAFGRLPAVTLRISDGFELVSRKASRVRMTVHNTLVDMTSHNVMVEIPGSRNPEEIVLFGAHYDSVPFSTGVYDNGAGSVVIMEVLRYFAEHPPVRTVRFLWFGSEEIGLEGSKAYVWMHKDELDRHVFMINCDVGGAVLGADKCRVTADEELLHFTEYFMKSKGYAVEVSHGIMSSDSTPFADAGVPAINFNRDGAPGAAFIHSRNDVIEYLSADALAGTTRHVLDFSETMVNSAIFPVKRVIPDKIRADLDRYLFKKELAELDK